MFKQQRHVQDSNSCQQLKFSISMLDSLLNKIRQPNNALNGKQSEKKKLGYLVLLLHQSFYRAGVYRPENRLVRPIFLYASER